MKLVEKGLVKKEKNSSIHKSKEKSNSVKKADICIQKYFI